MYSRMAILFVVVLVCLEIGLVASSSPLCGCECVKCGYGQCEMVKGQPKCVCPSICPQYIEQICGSDGNTYSNPCYMDIASCEQKTRITKASDGACEEQPIKGGISCANVRCGYGSKCEMIDGRPKCQCPSVCPLYFKEICGSDGKTYSNPCFMSVAACKEQKSITQVSEGACPTKSSPKPNSKNCDDVQCSYGARCQMVDGKPKCECPNICPMNYQPICGSDRVTYSNECFMNIASCKQQRRITKVSDGPCPQVKATPADYGYSCANFRCQNGSSCSMVRGVPGCRCPEACTDVYQPICASDGNTYSNSCYMNSAACKQQKTISKVSDGECNSGEESRDQC